MDSRSKWIWLEQGESVDQYAEFYDAFDWTGAAVKLRISADSNYAVYLNGRLAACGQYPDFPHYKIYDELDLTALCRMGHNHLGIVVWYYGQGNMGYFPGRAAVRYELWQDDQMDCFSQAATFSRLSRSYQNGLAKITTPQLGFSFRYDLTKEDRGWLEGRLNGFSQSAVVDQELPLFVRPVERPVIGEAVKAVVLTNENDQHFLIDLGHETVGLLVMRVTSQEEQELLITYGEHVADGGVRRLIDGRDFSMELRLKEGVNEYLNPFRRLGLRYLEVFAQKPVTIETLTVLPVEYPVKRNVKLPPMNEKQRRIYDTCVRTLELCMHDHYEDTPWREQALYAMDSRNQMLCGYDAFEEYAFARANLLLMSKDERSDGLLSICTPSNDRLAIPSFSLHYFTAVYEYTLYSGDLSLTHEVWPKLNRVLNAFTSRLEDGLIPVFEDKWHWNFYEWSDGMSGRLFQKDDRRFDAALNCLLSLALQAMQKLAGILQIRQDYASVAEQINKAVFRRFYDAQRGVFVNSTADDRASALVNSLAILCGAADEKIAASIAVRLTGEKELFTPATLSMLGFEYDALLKTDREAYRSFVLEDIARKYQKMLDAGATSFWETEAGESDFDNAGSLCHGWSAMPVHYYHLLLNEQSSYTIERRAEP